MPMPLVNGRHRQPAQALASFAVVGVALVAVVLAVGNLALWLYAQNVVVAAAQEAAVIASRENGTPLDGQRTARSLLVASLGSSADRVTTIDVRLDADVASCSAGNVDASSSGPSWHVAFAMTPPLCAGR